MHLTLVWNETQLRIAEQCVRTDTLAAQVGSRRDELKAEVFTLKHQADGNAKMLASVQRDVMAAMSAIKSLSTVQETHARDSAARPGGQAQRLGSTRLGG